MFQAQYLFDNETVYSPWFPREGDNLQIQVEIVNADTTLKVEVYTKNREDTGVPGSGNPLTPADSDINTSTSGVHNAQYLSGGTNAAKELVRFKFTTGITADKKVLFRMLPTVWWDDVEA